MAELTIDPTTIRKALDEFVESYKPSDTPTQEVGYVATAGDGIAHVTGLPGCMANELLTFEDGTLGLAFNLDAREIGVVILGDFTGIEEGQEVRRTGEVLSVPVGDGYLGRVVDPLGNPIDGLGEIKTEGRRILEAQAPDVMHRHPVDEPLSTGLKAIDIERIAVKFAECAPAACIEPSWRGAYGCSYANSGETARAVACFNGLLGCWNQKGGALFSASVKAGDVDKAKFPSVPKVEAKIAGQSEYPLSLSGMGVNVYAAQLAREGKMKGMFFYNSNMVAGYSNPAYLQECLANLELSVCIDVQMTETCHACDYVLPDTSYLERLELPEFYGGKIPAVAIRDQVIEKVHPNTKPVDQIFSELADACGVGQYFDFTVEELADAQLATVGLSLDGLRACGVSTFPEKAFKYGPYPKWKTPSGKFQFASDACEKAGLPRTPQWLEPAVAVPEDGKSFRLIGGKQAIHTHTQTANSEPLMAITKQYGLERVWMNAQRAEELGISDGDTVEVSNEQHTGKVQVKVTQRINPDALYMPSHYGCSSKEEKTAYGVGLRQMDYVPFRIEPGYGGICSQEAVVTVKKVGA